MTRKEALKALCCELFSSISKEKAYQKWKAINDLAVLEIEEYIKHGKLSGKTKNSVITDSTKKYDILAYCLFICGLDCEESVYDCWCSLYHKKIDFIEDVICYRRGLY